MSLFHHVGIAVSRPSSNSPANISSHPSLTASAMLQAAWPASLTAAPPLQIPGRISRALSSLSPVQAPQPSKLKKKRAPVHGSSPAGACDQAAHDTASSAALPADQAEDSASKAAAVTQPVGVWFSSTAAARPSSLDAGIVPDTSSKAAGQTESNTTAPERYQSAASDAKQKAAQPDKSDAAVSQPLQQQQPDRSRQADDQASASVAMQACSTVAKQSPQQASRPSTSGSKQGAVSCFDRRLALLHKGLPTHMPPPSAGPPSTPFRSRRGPTQGVLANPSLSLQAGLDPNPPSVPNPRQPQSSQAAGAAQQAHTSNAATCLLPLQAAMLLPEQHASTLAHPVATAAAATAGGASASAAAAAASAAVAEALLLSKEASLHKPCSPTSVLASTGLGDTTYHKFHGLADAYPDLYQAAAAAGKAHKASSRALQSFVGETLKGNPELWRQQLKSAYTMCNDRLKQDVVRPPCSIPFLLSIISMYLCRKSELSVLFPLQQHSCSFWQVSLPGTCIKQRMQYTWADVLQFGARTGPARVSTPAVY